MFRNTYMSKTFAAIRKQLIAAAVQEETLALYTSDYFINRFRPIATKLSELTGRTYIGYLFEAQEMILSGKTEEEVFEHFYTRLSKLQEEKQ